MNKKVEMFLLKLRKELGKKTYTVGTVPTV